MTEQIKKAEKKVAKLENNLKFMTDWKKNHYFSKVGNRYTDEDFVDAKDSLDCAKIKLEELKILHEYRKGKDTQEEGAMPKRDDSQVSHSHSG